VAAAPLPEAPLPEAPLPEAQVVKIAQQVAMPSAPTPSRLQRPVDS
jgi:hypothetical protein